MGGLRPPNEESAGKIESRRITHGNKLLRKTPVECGWAAARTKDSSYREFFIRQVISRKKNKMKIQVAVARKMTVAVWPILHDHTPLSIIDSHKNLKKIKRTEHDTGIL